MKKWKGITLGVLAVLLIRLEHTGVRIDTLAPVETVRIRCDGEIVLIETDVGAKGYGNDLEKAMENLNASSQTMVFLDTVEYILLDPNAEHLIAELDGFFRPNTVVCRMCGESDWDEITSYLEIHRPRMSLLDWEAGERSLQTLYIKEGRGQLAG